jgi:hypothetical protein
MGIPVNRYWASMWAVSVITLFLVRVSPADSPKRPKWSVDLVQHGFHTYESGSDHDYTTLTEVAATETVIAVGMMNLSPTSRLTRPYGDASTRWDLSLLFFDAKTGKLLAKRGPWRGDFAFTLFASSRGNFIVRLWNYHGQEGKRGERLLLFSSGGEQITDLFMEAPATDQNAHQWLVRISPSRSTLLLEQLRGGGVYGEILDANTLNKLSEWTDNRRDAPGILDISDSHMLGVCDSANPGRAPMEKSRNALCIRTFDGPWRPFSAYSRDAFLSDQVVVRLEDLEKEHGVRLTEMQIDGTALLSHAFQKRGYDLSSRTQITPSPDGRHFASVIVSLWWFWRELDMGPEDIELYIWVLNEPEPVLKVKLASQIDELSFSPDGTWLALEDWHTLRVIPLQSR